MADKVTIDDLAVMVKKGFDRVDEQFEAMDEKFTGKIDALEYKMNCRFDQVMAEIHDIKVRLDALEKRTLEDSDAAVKELLDLKRRVNILEKKLKIA